MRDELARALMYPAVTPFCRHLCKSRKEQGRPLIKMDGQMSVRFKHGIHTIYVFVDTLDSMESVGTEICELLRERYPDGLTTSIDPPKKTMVPGADEDFRVAYGVLNVPNDPTRGWKRLKIDDYSVNAGKAGLKENGIVAVAFLQDDEDEAVFEVEWPGDEEEMYE